MILHKRRQVKQNVVSRAVRDSKSIFLKKKRKEKNWKTNSDQQLYRKVKSSAIAKMIIICWKGKMFKVYGDIYLKPVIVSDFLISNWKGVWKHYLHCGYLKM